MNNTINRIKKRADTLAEYIIEKVERLEGENHKLKTKGREIYLELRTHELAFEKALDRITEVKEYQGNTIITFKGEDNNGDMDTLYTRFTQDEPLYPLAEMLLEKYEKEAEFKRVIKEASKRPLKFAKGE